MTQWYALYVYLYSYDTRRFNHEDVMTKTLYNYQGFLEGIHVLPADSHKNVEGDG